MPNSHVHTRKRKHRKMPQKKPALDVRPKPEANALAAMKGRDVHRDLPEERADWEAKPTGRRTSNGFGASRQPLPAYPAPR